ncbi:carboxymuconolactone decarboxylase [Frankia sp. CcI49]|uniref:carboxymuconolactone decarboxylase family protein n=1 Tax=Frankia sp. CcI49 TaxID=1745382 RepID=UPI00097839A1|nr:carboxymuconolactone decarboxylase family protein [Frankia sp. CcI49]ONH60797.1 carboxymuconolactone decarboxylase [Frankia sp. CcI49]
MARVEPIPPRQWPARMRDALAAMTPPEPRHPATYREGRPRALNSLGTFAHHPELARALFTLNGHVMRGTTLTARQRHLLIIRVAAVRGCGYVWAQNVPVGLDAGLTEGEIGRIALGPDAPFWEPLDAALLRAVDELIAGGTITDPTWAALAAELDTQQLLDVVLTVGAYEISAFMTGALQLDFDDDLKPASTPAAT